MSTCHYRQQSIQTPVEETPRYTKWKDKTKTKTKQTSRFFHGKKGQSTRFLNVYNLTKQLWYYYGLWLG